MKLKIALLVTLLSLVFVLPAGAKGCGPEQQDWWCGYDCRWYYCAGDSSTPEDELCIEWDAGCGSMSSECCPGGRIF